MKKRDKRQQDNNFIEQKIAEAFGYTDEQLAEELDWFAKEADKRDDKALDAPDGEFQRIWDRVERESGSHWRKGGRVRKFVKVMAVAAVLGTMVLGGGMWVGAKRHYVYEVQERRDLDNVIAINNSPDNIILDDASEEKEAYEKIKAELNMKVFELSYLPEEMAFHKLEILRNTGRMEFTYNKDYLYFYQGISDKPSSLSYASDMKECDKVYNLFLDREILIYEQVLEDGNVEFSVRIVEDNQYHILEGIINIDIFKKIVCGVRLHEN